MRLNTTQRMIRLLSVYLQTKCIFVNYLMKTSAVAAQLALKGLAQFKNPSILFHLPSACSLQKKRIIQELILWLSARQILRIRTSKPAKRRTTCQSWKSQKKFNLNPLFQNILLNTPQPVPTLTPQTSHRQSCNAAIIVQKSLQTTEIRSITNHMTNQVSKLIRPSQEVSKQSQA